MIKFLHAEMCSHMGVLTHAFLLQNLAMHSCLFIIISEKDMHIGKSNTTQFFSACGILIMESVPLVSVFEKFNQDEKWAYSCLLLCGMFSVASPGTMSGDTTPD